jgi:hypothetical protein
MERSPSREANSSAASYEIHLILWQPNVFRRLRKTPRSSLIQCTPSHAINIHFTVVLPSTLRFFGWYYLPTHCVHQCPMIIRVNSVSWTTWHWDRFGGQSDTETGLVGKVTLGLVWWTKWHWDKFGGQRGNGTVLVDKVTLREVWWTK